jgi:hypothetical protein
VSLAVATNILAALTGSASGGLTIALEALGPTYMKLAHEIGMNAALMHRVAVIGSGTLDSLPHNGAVVTLLSVYTISLTRGVYNLEGRQLIGSHLLHPYFIKELSDSPDRLGIRETADVYLCDTSRASFKSLSPLVRLDICRECRHQRVFLSDGGQIYIDVFIGHGTEVPLGDQN